MFEYFNGDVLKALMVFWIAAALLIGTLRKDNRKPFAIGTLVISAIALLLSMYIPFHIANDNLKKMQAGVTLKCSNDTSEYLVSKEDGWKLHENSFLKNSLLIRADKCEEQ